MYFFKRKLKPIQEKGRNIFVMKIIPIPDRYQRSYLIEGGSKWIIFDAGWSDSFQKFVSEIKNQGLHFEDIDYIIVSHFHMDHYGSLELLKQQGPTLLLFSSQLQVNSIEAANQFFVEKPDSNYVAITRENTKIVDGNLSRSLLKSIGIDGEIVATKGHSDDSVSLILDTGIAFTGNLPLYELRDAYGNDDIPKSWKMLLEKGITEIYPAHGQNYSP